MKWIVPIVAILATSCGPSPFDAPAYESPARIPIVHERSSSSAALFAEDSVLEVEALVAAVLARNPNLEAMERSRRAAVARRQQATALEDPMLSYAAAPQSLADRAMRDGHEVELSQRFPWPGKLRLRGQMAEHEAYAAAHDLHTARLRLAHETRRAFYDYYFAHRAIEINQANLDLLREFQRIAENKYAVGTAPKHDALQARVERLHLEHEALTLERTRRVVRAAINLLLHRSPEAQLPPPPAAVGRPHNRPQLEGLVESAVNARPELQALAQRLESARANRRLAAREYYPDVTVMTTYSTMWDDPEHRWMLGAGINLPLQVGRRRAAEVEALSESQRIAAELAAGVDQVAFEVAEAYEQVVESEHVIELYESQFLPTARENLDTARSGYEAAESDFLTFLTAERDQRLIELAYQRALAEYHQSWADLRRAVGQEVTPARSREQGDSSHD